VSPTVEVPPPDVVPVGCGGVRLGFNFRRLFCGTHAAGAEVGTVLYVVVPGERRNPGGSSGNLGDAVKDDLGAAVVEFDLPVNFNHPASKAADVAHLFQVVGENYDREGARHCVFAEVEEVNSLYADLNPHNLSGHALRLADLLVGLVDWYAIGGGEQRRREQDYDKRDPVWYLGTKMASRSRALPGWTAEGGCPHMRSMNSEPTSTLRMTVG